MTHFKQCEERNAASHLRATNRAFAWGIALVVMMVAGPIAQAQTFTVLHKFTGTRDGSQPYASLTMDRAGNLYGTTFGGGSEGSGTVFKLARKGSSWLLTPLYSFPNPVFGAGDGYQPMSPVTIGPDGSLYGSTEYGGRGDCGQGCGVVFNVRPPAKACASALCGWLETVLYRFPNFGGGDGYAPLGAVVFDQAGNLYGTASGGGATENGAVYELSPSHGQWIESIAYSFPGGAGGSGPTDGVIFDQANNLYGAAFTGGAYGNGIVYQLTPSGSGWTENILYSFQVSDGSLPYGGLLLDPSGNIYGTLTYGGPGGVGTVFEVTTRAGGWSGTLIHSFYGSNGIPGPTSTLARDAAGNLYGTTFGGDILGCFGGYGCGNVFRLTPTSGGWVYTSLHDFTGDADGGNPWGGVIVDASGNLYGTTTYGNGTVFEITP